MIRNLQISKYLDTRSAEQVIKKDCERMKKKQNKSTLQRYQALHGTLNMNTLRPLS